MKKFEYEIELSHNTSPAVLGIDEADVFWELQQG